MKNILLEKLKITKSSAMPIWLKRNPNVLSWLIEQTKDYSDIKSTQRLYILMHGEPPKCSDGNYRKFNTFDLGYRTCCHLGNKCKSVTEDRLSKHRNTMMNLYGVENSFQLESVQNKIRATTIARYGTEYSAQNKEVMQRTIASRKIRTKEQLTEERNKSKQTNMETYGVDHHMKLKGQQQKVKTTNLLIRGVEFPLQSKESVEKLKETQRGLNRESIIHQTKNTLIDRYGVTAASRINIPKSTLDILDDRDKFCDYVNGKERKTVLAELGIGDMCLYLYAKKYDATNLFTRPLVSQFEIDVANWLTSINIRFKQNDRSVISPKELDFYLLDHNLAIECSGLYWHSELSAGRISDYHSSKYLSCKDQGIQLITIFDDEWRDKQNIVKQIISNKVATNNTIFARKCKVVELSSDEASTFISATHIQGYTPSTVKLGLTFSEELVAVMTFGKSRFDKNIDWELIRYCSSNNVIGGASKLLTHFINTQKPKSIVSYSDNRWFNGKMYEKLGFEYDNETIGYFYTDYVHRYNRVKFQKYKLVKEGFDSALSEWEIMQQRKFDRVWDCGQTRWIHKVN